MNKKGEIILAVALIIAGAVIIGSLFVAYKPVFDCRIYTSKKLNKLDLDINSCIARVH